MKKLLLLPLLFGALLQCSYAEKPTDTDAPELQIVFDNPVDAVDFEIADLTHPERDLGFTFLVTPSPKRDAVYCPAPAAVEPKRVEHRRRSYRPSFGLNTDIDYGSRSSLSPRRARDAL